MSRRWTAEEDALIRRPDRPLSELAKAMGRSVTALHQRRSEKGYSKPARPIEAEPGEVKPARSRRMRRIEQQGWVKPEVEAGRSAPRLRRKCLSCGQPFDTTRFVYVCSTCKSHDIWRCAS